MRNMNNLLEKIYHAQISHYSRVESLLSTLVQNSRDPSQTTHSPSLCQQVQQVYPRQVQLPTRSSSNGLNNDTKMDRSASSAYNTYHFTPAPPDTTWDSLFQPEPTNGSSPI